MPKIKNKVTKILREYIEEVNKLCQIDKAILFGSHAHGKDKKVSDIDIAIFSRKINDENRLEIMSKFIMLIDKFKIDIQPIVFSYKDYLDEDNDFISNEIKRRGIEIYSN
jgi:predicted nucleotidyltransferase